MKHILSYCIAFTHLMKLYEVMMMPQCYDITAMQSHWCVNWLTDVASLRAKRGKMYFNSTWGKMHFTSVAPVTSDLAILSWSSIHPFDEALWSDADVAVLWYYSNAKPLMCQLADRCCQSAIRTRSGKMYFNSTWAKMHFNWMVSVALLGSWIWSTS